MLENPMVVSAAALVLVTVLTGLAALVGKWVNERSKNAQAAAITERVLLEVTAAVAQVGQCYVDELKAANEDGVITPSEAAEALFSAQGWLVFAPTWISTTWATPTCGVATRSVGRRTPIPGACRRPSNSRRSRTRRRSRRRRC